MKVGIGQSNKPAPLWYRRLSNALIVFIIPGCVALVQGWGLPDNIANRWLLVLAFIPAVIKGVGVLLGNGQNYTRADKRIQVWALIIGAAALSQGCRTGEEIAASRAAKEAAAREQRLQLYQQVRIAYPCTLDTVIRGLTVYLPGDSVPCPANGKCPPPGIRVDTLKVLDEAALAAVRDSLAQANYIDSLKDVRIDELAAGNAALAAALASERDKTAFWRRIVLWAGGIIVSVLVGWLVIGGKLSFIKKAISWLISFVR